MKLELQPEEQAFQEKIERFIEDHWPGALGPHNRPGPRQSQAWFECLLKAGWTVPSWPVEHGGTNWTATEQYLWEQALIKAHCPQMDPFGTKILAPTIYTQGSRSQQQRFLPPIREARVQWCQGFTEATAGSDLTALSTQAERQSDLYIVNGIKTWVSNAHIADWIFCLVRTAPEPEAGITFLLIDMQAQGITVNAIPTLGRQSLSQVVLKNVRVPVDQRVGREGEGLRYANSSFDLAGSLMTEAIRSRLAYTQLEDIANSVESEGRKLADDEIFRKKMSLLDIDLVALEISELRALAKIEKGEDVVVESAILKIKGAEVAQNIAELKLEAHGYYAIPYPERYYLDNEGPIGPESALPSVMDMFASTGASLFGESSEIQRNKLAKRVLDK